MNKCTRTREQKPRRRRITCQGTIPPLTRRRLGWWRRWRRRGWGGGLAELDARPAAIRTITQQLQHCPCAALEVRDGRARRVDGAGRDEVARVDLNEGIGVSLETCVADSKWSSAICIWGNKQRRNYYRVLMVWSKQTMRRCTLKWVLTRIRSLIATSCFAASVVAVAFPPPSAGTTTSSAAHQPWRSSWPRRSGDTAGRHDTDGILG